MFRYCYAQLMVLIVDQWIVKHVSKLTNGLGEYCTELGLDTRVLGDLD